MGDQYFVNAGKLNLRARPERTAAIVAVLPRGQMLDAVAAPTSGWVEVTTTSGLADLHGYVNTDYVFEIHEPPATVASAQVTRERLARFTPTGKDEILAAIVAGFVGPDAISIGLGRTSDRVCHFLAQAAHESMGFTHLHELGGPTYWQRYEGRADLGNVRPGDGVRYHGRGIFQLTGRANYRSMGALLGVDLVEAPDLAADPTMAFRIACRFWTRHGLNDLADQNDIVGITRRINGGTTGLAERTLLLSRARAVWG